MSGPLFSGRIQCYQGIDLEETRLFFSEGGSKNLQDVTPLDFTGSSARMMIRLRGDPSAELMLSLATGAIDGGLTWVTDTFPGGPVVTAPNGIQIDIGHVRSLTMNAGVPFVGGYYDVIVTALSGATTLLMAGQFDLLPTVTRTDT